MTQLLVLNDAAVTGNQTELFMEYPEQTIKRLTQRLGRAPTPEEIKAERTDRRGLTVAHRLTVGLLLRARAASEPVCVRDDHQECVSPRQPRIARRAPFATRI